MFRRGARGHGRELHWERWVVYGDHVSVDMERVGGVVKRRQRLIKMIWEAGKSMGVLLLQLVVVVVVQHCSAGGPHLKHVVEVMRCWWWWMRWRGFAFNMSH